MPFTRPDGLTLDNWQDGPWNRWAYQHISHLIPTAQIGRGSGPVAPLERRERDLSDLRFERSNGRPVTLRDMLAETYTDGFVVLHDGAVVYERYFNGMTDSTLHLFQSVSKSLTGMLAGILVADGRLELDRAIGDYLPELRDSGYADATIRQALDMLVSIRFSEIYDDPASDMNRQDRAAAWRPLLPGDIDGLYRFAATIPKDRAHGEIFQYCSLTTDMLGWVLSRVSGLTFAELLSRELWVKLGCEHDAIITVDRFDSPTPSGGICTTTRDLARFGQMVLRDGFANGVQIVPASWVDDTRFGGDVQAFARNTEHQGRPPGGAYRNQWWITNDEHGTFYGGGVYGQHVWIDPVARVVIAKLSTRPAPLDQALNELTHRGFAAIARALG
jgi:CubicO group peptidase (beta-lactamase class C family)